MALVKQPVSLNFSRGLETKADPFQVAAGSFLAMQNSVFTTTGRLTKRNGFANITTLPNDQQTTLTTLNGNLIATGSNLYAYSSDTDAWLNQGNIQPVDVSVKPLVRVSTSQSSPDMAIAPNGLACLVYVDNGVSYYQMSDSVTGQQIIGRTQLPGNAGQPRVLILGLYYVIIYTITIAGSPHLQYLPIPIMTPGSPGTSTDISTTVASLTAGYDAVVANNTLYIGWAASASSLGFRYITSTLVESSLVTVTGHTATLMSLTADISGVTPIIWASFWDSSSTNGYSMAFNFLLVQELGPTQIITALPISEITSVATAGLQTVLYENINTYPLGPINTIRTDFISKVLVTQSGAVTQGTGYNGGNAADGIIRSVGLASKAFINEDNGQIYVLVAYGQTNQPSYFLIDSNGNIYMRLAYSNGGGYAQSQVLPSISVIDSSYYTPYLIKDFLATINKGTNLPAGTPVNGIYTQTGINLAKFSINNSHQYSSEIAGSLFLTGGQLWQYDGVRPVEDGFQVWPEDIGVETNTTGGSIGAGTYYYVFTYEWTDAQGNLQRSAPSIPVSITTTGSTSSNNIYVPTLRLTGKLDPNGVRIVGYRWSTAQQVYYQFTSITQPAISEPYSDEGLFIDRLSDASILGQTLLYTTGGTVENIAPPASIASALFNNRLWLIDAEDRNLLWYSKQVIEATPVEMSDLFTIYVAPTTGAQGSTGDMTALSAMDDKLIIFKKDAIYYINGTGPDNTGANSGYSDAIFITAAVGCANPASIVLQPAGIMFQSDKGIWLLGRDLSTTYIGAPVEKYNDSTIMSAQAIPGTNQVRFVLSNKIMLMYDYYFSQWATFSSLFAISSTLYQGEHTYLNTFGKVYQETPGAYIDGSTPVLMSLTTSWINVAGLQGYERFYFANLLGTYITPFKLNIQFAYDYNPSQTQQVLITPDNAPSTWGSDPLWGSGGPWGGPGNVFSARIFPTEQKCQSFQVTINEIYDGSLGYAAGAGLTLSGLALVVGLKRGYRTQSAAKSYG